MKKNCYRKQNVLLAFIIPSALLFQGCGRGLDVAETPVLQNLLVDIQPCSSDPCTGSSTAGDFSFSPTGSSPLVFGASVSANSGGNKIIPNIELRVLSTANVRSPVDAVVSSIEKSKSEDDYAITLSSSALSAYTISIDHVTELTVSKGSEVRAGDILGKPGIWYPNLGIGRVELQMKKGSDFVCPMDFLSTEVAADLKNRMKNLLEDWEQVKGDTSLFDESKMSTPGCLKSVIKDSEA